jgi:hypothetical protein
MIDRYRRNLLLSLCWCALISATGCLRVAPRMPAVLSNPAPIAYTPAALDADIGVYRAALAGNKPDAAKVERNAIVYHLIAQIDLAYGAFELSLSTRRAGAQTAGDAAQLGVTAAATVVGATAVKDILTATATALQGTTISFDKNFFEQKTTEALISQMRATRKTQQAQMLLSLANRDVVSYPLESAWVDVTNYYYAGTISSALVDMASKAGGDAVTADQNLKETVKKLTPGQESVNVRTAYERLNKQIASGEEVTVASAKTILVKLLTAANITFDANASASDLLQTLRSAMADALNDETNAKLAKLNAAAQAAFN